MARRTAASVLGSQLSPFSRSFSSTIFVSRLSAYTTDERFQKLFEPFGTIKEVRLIKDPITKRPKGFGFIEYQSEVEANKAIRSMNFKILDGRLVFVEMAKKLSKDEAISSSHCSTFS